LERKILKLGKVEQENEIVPWLVFLKKDRREGHGVAKKEAAEGTGVGAKSVRKREAGPEKRSAQSVRSQARTVTGLKENRGGKIGGAAARTPAGRESRKGRRVKESELLGSVPKRGKEGSRKTVKNARRLRGKKGSPASRRTVNPAAKLTPEGKESGKGLREKWREFNHTKINELSLMGDYLSKQRQEWLLRTQWHMVIAAGERRTSTLFRRTAPALKEKGENIYIETEEVQERGEVKRR